MNDKHRLLDVVRDQASLDEGNRNELFAPFHDISGLPVALSASDFEGTGIKDRYSPLLDNGFVSHYNDVIDGAKKVGIIRQTFEAQAWVDPAYLNRSLKELGLEGYWAPTNAAVLVAAR